METHKTITREEYKAITTTWLETKTVGTMSWPKRFLSVVTCVVRSDVVVDATVMRRRGGRADVERLEVAAVVVEATVVVVVVVIVVATVVVYVAVVVLVVVVVEVVVVVVVGVVVDVVILGSPTIVD
jgi:hypothetical protein